MLLGYRISQKSILWPLVAVMLPGWLLLVALVRRPNTDLHTQLALRARVAQQMLAYDHAEKLVASPQGQASLPARRAAIESIYRQADQAGLIKDQQRADEAVVWHRLGDHDRAVQLLAEIKEAKVVSPYLAIVQKKVLNQPLTPEDLQKLNALLPNDDWWRQTMQGPSDADTSASFASQQWRAWWELRLADLLLPALGIAALVLVVPAINLLRGTWTIWPYSERVQHLWPMALMLCVVSLRGLFLLLGNTVAGIVLPLISWAGQHDIMTVFHIQVCLGFIFNILILAATTFGVKESVAPHWGSLGDVLGFERGEFLNRKLWCVAFTCAIALAYALRPLAGVLDGLHVGGPSIYDSLSRSPGGYNALGAFLSIVQAVLLAPFFEEVIYRGFLLSALRNFRGPVFGVMASSAIFALAHGSSFTGMVTALILGIAYAQIKLHTGRLSAAVLLHTCVAAVQTSLLLLQGG